MPHYQAFDPRAEMTGLSVLSFTRSILHEDIAAILKRRHLDNIDSQAWYPVQSLLDVFSEISEVSNTSSIFISIGVAAAQLGLEALPPAMKTLSLPEFFVQYEAVWASRHRNGDGGSVTCTQVDDHHLILTVKTPYPDDVFYGAIYAYTRYFCPQDKVFSLSYDKTVPTRDNGGDETLIHVQLQDA
jgi:hypothetical protein